MESEIELQIGKWGNSLGIRLPKFISKVLNLHSKDRMNCSLKDGRLILEPVRKPQYNLDDLLAEVDETSEEISWGKPKGKEIW